MKQFSISLFLVVVASTQAFVTPRVSRISYPPIITPSPNKAVFDQNRGCGSGSTVHPRSSTTLRSWSTELLDSGSGGILSGADPGLVLGMAMIAAALTPYVLGLFLPEMMSDNFFLPVYKNATVLEEEGKEITLSREAEIQWKLMYSTLGLVLTTLAFAEVLLVKDLEAVEVLRDSYVVWALFYTFAIVKIRREANELEILAVETRFFIQLWHLIVVVVMWISVGSTPGKWTSDTLQAIVELMSKKPWN